MSGRHRTPLPPRLVRLWVLAGIGLALVLIGLLAPIWEA